MEMAQIQKQSGLDPAQRAWKQQRISGEVALYFCISLALFFVYRKSVFLMYFFFHQVAAAIKVWELTYFRSQFSPWTTILNKHSEDLCHYLRKPCILTISLTVSLSQSSWKRRLVFVSLSLSELLRWPLSLSPPAAPSRRISSFSQVFNSECGNPPLLRNSRFATAAEPAETCPRPAAQAPAADWVVRAARACLPPSHWPAAQSVPYGLGQEAEGAGRERPALPR